VLLSSNKLAFAVQLESRHDRLQKGVDLASRVAPRLAESSFFSQKDVRKFGQKKLC